MAYDGRYSGNDDRDRQSPPRNSSDDRGRDRQRGSSRSHGDDRMIGSGWESDREQLGWGSSGDHRDRGDHQATARDRTSDGHRGPDRDRSDNRGGDRDRSSGGESTDERGGHESAYQDRHANRSDRQRDDSQRDRDPRDEAAHRDRGYGSDDQRQGLPIDETDSLIASNKVEGTSVYGLDGDRLGSIYNFMVDKVSGRVDYAVMTYGGFLGMGTRYYPLPWKILKYDTRRNGYRVDLTARDMERAPSFDRNSEPRFDREYSERVHNWYGLND